MRPRDHSASVYALNLGTLSYETDDWPNMRPRKGVKTPTMSQGLASQFDNADPEDTGV